MFFKTSQLMLTYAVLKVLDELVTSSFEAFTVSYLNKTSNGICINEEIFTRSLPRPRFRALCCSSASDATAHPQDLWGMQGMQPTPLIQAQVYHKPLKAYLLIFQRK